MSGRRGRPGAGGVGGSWARLEWESGGAVGGGFACSYRGIALAAGTAIASIARAVVMMRVVEVMDGSLRDGGNRKLSVR